MSVQVLDPRRDPEPPDWPELQRCHGLHPTWDYGLLGIEAWMSRNPPLLAIARDGDRPIAVLSAMVCRPARSPAYAGLPTVHSRQIWPRWIQVYQPWSAEPAFAIDDGVHRTERRRVVRRLERALRGYLGPGLLGVVYRNVPDAAVSDLAGAGRLVREVHPAAALLENRWHTGEEWLADLSRNRRKSVRKVDQAVAADHTVLVRGGPARRDLDGAELAELLRTHRARHGRQRFDPRTPVAAAYLDALVRRDDVHTLTYADPGGRVLAFCTILDHPTTPVLQFWASRPRDSGGRPHLYFDCQARAVRYTIRTGRRELSAGRAMLTEKRSLGFGTRRVWVVVVPGPVVGR